MTIPEFSEDGVELVHQPKHYDCPFPIKKITCDTFVSLMPFYLGCAFKYIWRAGRKPGEPIERDLGKAAECMRLWDDVSDGWTEHGKNCYPNELTVRYMFETLLRDEVEEQWRMDLLEAIVHNADAQFVVSQITFVIEDKRMHQDNQSNN